MRRLLTIIKGTTMAVAIKVPSIAESIVEGVLSQWLKKDGELVRENEPLFELETDKATQPIPAPATGVLHITVPEGKTVAVGAEVGRIEPGETPVKKSEAPARTEADQKPIAKAPAPKPAREDQKPAPTPTPAATPALAPSVRRLVQQEGLDVSKVPGTGRGGRVTREDVMQYLDHQQAQPAPANLPAGEPPWGEPTPTPAAARAPVSSAEFPRSEHRQRMSPVRQRIAQKLLSSQQTTATLTTFNEADLSAVMELRQRYKDRFKERYGVSLGFMSFFVKACVEGLRAFPLLNGRIDGNEIVTHDYCHIGVAVSTDKGLMVPVVHDADLKSFAQIEQEVIDLAAKARDGTISVEDLQGGTFTITNGGIFGSLLSTPILYPGQSAILGMHAIQRRPVAVNEQVVIRPMMYLALSYDHRLIDGREAVQFLVRVKECVESPDRLLLEI
jgi:2-oxoglutarate dehydrogenase E2 component (dihydrolipoamide succinyltransferase)